MWGYIQVCVGCELLVSFVKDGGQMKIAWGKSIDCGCIGLWLVMALMDLGGGSRWAIGGFLDGIWWDGDVGAHI